VLRIDRLDRFQLCICVQARIAMQQNPMPPIVCSARIVRF